MFSDGYRDPGQSLGTLMAAGQVTKLCLAPTALPTAFLPTAIICMLAAAAINYHFLDSFV